MLFFGASISNLVGLLLGTLYPAYRSFKALQTEDSQDDTQWLTYWVCFSFLKTAEFFGEFILSWVPFYYEIKIVLILWLILPQYNGASIVYNSFIKAHIQRVVKQIQEKAQLEGFQTVKLD